MRKNNSNFRNSWLLAVCLILLLPFISISISKAQDIQILIKGNHKVYLPDGEGPFRVIIAVPGCSGVSLDGPETDKGRPGDEADRLFRRHYPIMAERLKEHGFMVLLIDYLSAEGVFNTCDWTIHPTRVGEYINEAITFVKKIPKVDTMGIHVMGWSHGGEGVISWLTNLDNIPNGVQSAITIYPGCSTSDPWESSLPVLMLLGDADDIALPGLCRSMIEALPKQTNILIKTYQEARHGFDLTEGPNVLSIGNGLTIGRNLKAGEESWYEILSFLK